MLAMAPMVFTPVMIFNSVKDGENSFALKCVAVFIVATVVWATAPKTGTNDRTSGDCYTDWDGRSNPTVCD